MRIKLIMTKEKKYNMPLFRLINRYQIILISKNKMKNEIPNYQKNCFWYWWKREKIQARGMNQKQKFEISNLL